MSLKLAAAKLSATAAGVALMTGGALQVAQQGGAVRTAEPMTTEEPEYTTDLDGRLVETERQGKYVKTAPQIAEPKYIKTRQRAIPEPEPRRRRIVERTIECEPYAGAPGSVASSLPQGATQAYFDPAECPPIQQVAYAPAPLPPLPPIGGGGAAPAIIGGGLGGFGGGFGGGFFGGFFGGGGGGSSSGDVSVSTTTSTSGGSTSGDVSSGGTTSTGGSDGIVIDIDIDNSTSTTSSSGTVTSTSSTGSISSSTGQVSTSTSTGAVSSSTGGVSTSTSTSSGNVSSSTGAVSSST
ncbi:hypothetical protein, partial [Erythrobacter sp.]|uniref:hypothetical protein n=1 Tax=Erythrobacter sp. TaxID=1042 RepID=UPI002ECDB84D|nr:hypothetical protein [Erythrobacter sp.]